MKKLLLTLVAIAIATYVFGQNNYTREGNNFTKTVTVAASQDSLTTYTFTVKDVVYPIWVTKSGRCYIVRTSKNGNQYRQYIEESIARQICKEMGIEYVETKKSTPA